MSLVLSFNELVQPLSVVMTQPSFHNFMILITGWIFARRHTVTGAIVAAGAIYTKHFSTLHRFFSAAHWSLDRLGLCLAGLILEHIEGVVILTLDDTLAHKRGLKMFGAGMHHDPLHSTRKKAVLSWGHSWVVLGIQLKVPLCPNRVFTLPILFRLYLNRASAKRWRLTYRKRTELAVEIIEQLCEAFPKRFFHVVADSTYGSYTVLNKLPERCGLTSRVDLKARLYSPLSGTTGKKRGRPRKRGERLPSPMQMLEERGHRIHLTHYGRKDYVRIVERVACLYKTPHRPLKIVAVEPLRGGRPVQAFYSTRITDTAQEVLHTYARRWSIEESNQGSKSLLGFEEPQGWSRHAVRRTAPMAMLLYSLIILWFARTGYRFYRDLKKPWYQRKQQPSFADMLVTLKRTSLIETIFAHLGPSPGVNKIAQVLECTMQT